MAFVTVMSLFYLHMQMKIYDLAYKAKLKEHQIQKLKDDNGVATYHILSLKSANNIGQKLLSQESSMQFVSNDRVHELAFHNQNQNSQHPISKASKNAIGNLSLSLQSFLTLTTAQAEAQPMAKY